MEHLDWIRWLGLVASVVLPVFNIPLMLKMRERKSSRDISLAWALGVFSCLLLMLPSALTSADLVFKVFSIVNTLLFSGVVGMVLYYRKI